MKDSIAIPIRVGSLLIECVECGQKCYIPFVDKEEQVPLPDGSVMLINKGLNSAKKTADAMLSKHLENNHRSWFEVRE